MPGPALTTAKLKTVTEEQRGLIGANKRVTVNMGVCMHDFMLTLCFFVVLIFFIICKIKGK